MEREKSSFLSENKHLIILSIINFLFIYISSFVKGYGYFIDEFYYIACAIRPAMGYVDHPPLAPLLLSIYQVIFGNSILSIRILPAIAGSLSVYFAGIIAKEIGGGKFAQLLAALTMAAAPVFVVMASFYSMNVFEPLFAILCLYYVIKLIKGNNPKKWIALGILFGLGVMNKLTFGIFILFLLISIIITGNWKLFFNKWFILGGLLGFVIFLPNIIWQVLNNYPSIVFYKNITTYKNIYTPPIEFLKGQILFVSITSIPIWICGLVYLLISKTQKEVRFISVLYLVSLIFMLAVGSSRPDRMAFAYPGIIAGGAIFFEKIILKYNFKWLKEILISIILLGLIISLPFILPYFSYEQIAEYVKKTGFNTELEKGKKPPLPQIIADRIGWEEKVNLVIKAYNNLNDENKKNAVISANNYGDAGAIELYGKKYNIPPVFSGHNTYFLWGKALLEKGQINPETIIQLTYTNNFDKLKENFEFVEPCDGEFDNPYVSSHENNLKVFICRKPKFPLNEMFEKSKFYY